jgi:hypothetical protein
MNVNRLIISFPITQKSVLIGRPMGKIVMFTVGAEMISWEVQMMLAP